MPACARSACTTFDENSPRNARPPESVDSIHVTEYGNVWRRADTIPQRSRQSRRRKRLPTDLGVHPYKRDHDGERPCWDQLAKTAVGPDQHAVGRLHGTAVPDGVYRGGCGKDATERGG